MDFCQALHHGDKSEKEYFDKEVHQHDCIVTETFFGPVEGPHYGNEHSVEKVGDQEKVALEPWILEKEANNDDSEFSGILY